MGSLVPFDPASLVADSIRVWEIGPEGISNAVDDIPRSGITARSEIEPYLYAAGTQF